MYSEKTLRRKANNIGYKIVKGFTDSTIVKVQLQVMKQGIVLLTWDAVTWLAVTMMCILIFGH